MHFLLMYELSPDYLERRGEFRNEHLKLGWEAHDRGEMVLAGPLSEPFDTALLMFSGETPEAAERFARNDPYVINGLVKRWSVRQWITAIGEGAATPLRPA